MLMCPYMCFQQWTGVNVSALLIGLWLCRSMHTSYTDTFLSEQTLSSADGLSYSSSSDGSDHNNPAASTPLFLFFGPIWIKTQHGSFSLGDAPTQPSGQRNMTLIRLTHIFTHFCACNTSTFSRKYTTHYKVSWSVYIPSGVPLERRISGFSFWSCYPDL
ncbi:hypothetical protein ATANTOWER_012129 [Ataeniobius toweri]|uniref:Secreted protein n=1 Tax=Ataeniobius toweri TaxID=208326 RepID=A0ABU7AF03_9TELE|nr:hypothetical protein [Ataeniobius toweri]